MNSSFLPSELKKYRHVHEQVTPTIIDPASTNLQNPRSRGVGFPCLRHGGTSRYRLADILQHCEHHQVEPRG